MRHGAIAQLVLGAPSARFAGVAISLCREVRGRYVPAEGACVSVNPYGIFKRLSRSQRSHHRYRLAPGSISVEGLVLDGGAAADLSLSGAFLPCRPSRSTTGPVFVSLRDGATRLEARIVRRATHGVGVEFVGVTAAQTAQLSALLKRLDAADSPSLFAQARGATLGGVMTSLIHGVSSSCKVLPAARQQLAVVEVLRDVRYGPSDDPLHLLDVYRPRQARADLPALLFLHGGGFRSLRKETYWMMAAGYAHRGYTVFLPNYRLAPRHPFPAAHEDAASAFQFVLDHAPKFGVHSGRVALAGDSAGANLALALTLACVTPRPEAWARALFDRAAMPHSVSLLSSLLQVRGPERLYRGNALEHATAPHQAVEQLQEIERTYLGEQRFHGFDLADPLCILEELSATERELPPLFSSVGRRDALLSDTYRLESVYRALGGSLVSHVYPTAFHAFQPILWREDSRQSWADAHAFLERCEQPATLRGSARPCIEKRAPLELVARARISSRPPPSLHAAE
ncbi:MAG: alpha/beta hydrolase fold domain-containing protein [Polyangiaceae bacterium]